MSAYIRKYVSKCDLYQRNKNKNVSTLGLLHPLHIPNKKWEEIPMDFIEGLPISDGKYKILVVVDRLTKYAHFMTQTATQGTFAPTRTFFSPRPEELNCFFKSLIGTLLHPQDVLYDLPTALSGNRNSRDRESCTWVSQSQNSDIILTHVSLASIGNIILSGNQPLQGHRSLLPRIPDSRSPMPLGVNSRQGWTFSTPVLHYVLDFIGKS
jgi:hypothetical protein